MRCPGKIFGRIRQCRERKRSVDCTDTYTMPSMVGQAEIRHLLMVPSILRTRVRSILFFQSTFPTANVSSFLTIRITFYRSSAIPTDISILFAKHKVEPQTRQFRKFSFKTIILLYIHSTVSIGEVIRRHHNGTFLIAVFLYFILMGDSVSPHRVTQRNNVFHNRSIQTMILPILSQPVTETFIIISRCTESLHTQTRQHTKYIMARTFTNSKRFQRTPVSHGHHCFIQSKTKSRHFMSGFCPKSVFAQYQPHMQTDIGFRINPKIRQRHIGCLPRSYFGQNYFTLSCRTSVFQ